MEPKERLSQDIGKFIEVYRVLNSESRAAFAAQMEATLKSVDPKTRGLYEALIYSAKDNCSLEETIDNMNRAAAGKPYK